MIKRMLINAAQTDELRVAITADSVLVDLDIEHAGQEQKKSNIYKGTISSIEPSLGAVFVNYGSERHGFLPLKEISPEYFLTSTDGKSFDEIDIKKVLKEDQEIVVQVDKEERGTKGAALTTFITLAGCYLVLMPNNPDAGGISRRIEGEERDQLRETIEKIGVPEGMGVIIRTAGVDRSKEELEWDLGVLLRYWEAIKQAAIAKPGPYLIHQESDVIIRAIRDHLRQDISEIVIDDASAFERAKAYIQQVRPDFIEHLKLYSDTMPLFSRFQIERQIENAYQREVRLPSGGSIVIDHSEALVAIDINSARATRGGNIEETALQTNLEAADEIAKQLRIRDIGGLVVIDFIDMTPIRNQREVENRLRNALRQDRARIQIGRISRFGLLEMSRQRLRAALSLSTEHTCPRCEGRGTIRSVESVAISILHVIQETASRSGSGTQIQVQLPLDVATFLINEKRDAIREIETQSSVVCTMIPNKHLRSPHYQIRNTRDEQSKFTPSYQLVKTPRTEASVAKPAILPTAAEPVIRQYLTDEQPPAPKKPQSNGLIKRLWDIMFGASEPTVKKATPVSSSNKGKRQPLVPHPTSDRGERSTRNDRGDRGQRQGPGNRQQKRPSQRSDNRNTRDNRSERGERSNPRSNFKDRNRDDQNKSSSPAKQEEKIEVNEAIQAIHSPMPAVSAPQHAPVPVMQQPEPKPIEPIAAPKAEVTPKPEFVPPPVPATPANYKGLASGKPLQQVVTKK